MGRVEGASRGRKDPAAVAVPHLLPATTAAPHQLHPWPDMHGQRLSNISQFDPIYNACRARPQQHAMSSDTVKHEVEQLAVIV